MLGLTKEQIKEEVKNWHANSFHETSSLRFAVNYQNEKQWLGKTMDVITNEILPSVLSHIIEKNNEAISKQLEK